MARTAVFRLAAGLLAGLLLPLAVACAPESRLAPGPNAEVTAEGATAAAGGVRLTVTPGAWSGRPGDLDELTAVLVRVVNHTDRRIAIRHSAFSLASDSVRLRAVPPKEVDGTVLASPGGAGRSYLDRFSYAGFEYAPAYAGLSGFTPYGHGVGRFGFGRHRGFGHLGSDYRAGFHGYSPVFPYGGYGAASYAYPAVYDPYRRVELPTRDMLLKAVPAGVLEGGGRLTGYLYFPRPGDSVERARFEAVLEEAGTGQVVSRVEIPLVMRG